MENFENDPLMNDVKKFLKDNPVKKKKKKTWNKKEKWIGWEGPKQVVPKADRPREVYHDQESFRTSEMKKMLAETGGFKKTSKLGLLVAQADSCTKVQIENGACCAECKNNFNTIWQFHTKRGFVYLCSECKKSLQDHQYEEFMMNNNIKGCGIIESNRRRH